MSSYPYDLNVKYGEENFEDDEGTKGREYAHDVVRNLMSDGLNDESSLVTIRDYSDELTAKMRGRSGVEFFDGSDSICVASSVSQLPVDDRVVAGAGHLHICSNSRKIYKALSTAIDAKMVRFTGVFDCVNRYALSGVANPEGVLAADRPVPYYFHEESPLRGVITFNEVLPTGDGRHVIIVNVDNGQRALTHSISAGTVIYLGGTHDESLISSVTSSSTHSFSTLGDGLLFPVFSTPLELSPGGSDMRLVISSSPWERTYGGGNCGRNVALAKMKNGNFLYWGTDYSPSAGFQLSPLPLSEIPIQYFAKDCGWPSSVGEAIFDGALTETFEGAWVMRGARLLEVVEEGLYPDGVLERLRGGFDRISNISCNFSAFRIYNRVNKVLRLLESTNGAVEGFCLVDGGKYECTIEALAKVSRPSAAALGAFISSCGLSNRCFFDVPFAGRAMRGTVKLVGGIPTGEWMNGRLIPTSAGLLYNMLNDSYHSFDNIDGISYVHPYTGGLINVGKNLKIAPRIQ